MNIIKAYGVLASPMQLSAALTNLRVSHVVVDDSLMARPRVKDVAVRQPAWPVILPSLTALRRHWLDYDRQIIYVCGSLAEFRSTNLQVLNSWRDNLQKSLGDALSKPVGPGWRLSHSEPTMADFVNVASKPSFLTFIQTEIYRINPYDLRKQVQALVIGYLAGTESQRTLKQKLASSYKLDRLKALLSHPDCEILRAAVADYRKIGDEEQVAKAHGVETFDIMYLFKSGSKKPI